MKNFIEYLRSLLIKLFGIDVHIPINVKVLASPLEHEAIADMIDVIFRKNVSCTKIVLCGIDSEMATVLKQYVDCKTANDQAVLYTIVMKEDTVLEVSCIIGTSFGDSLSNMLKEHKNIFVFER